MPGNRKYAFLALLTASLSILALYVHRHRQGQTGWIDQALVSGFGGAQKHASYFGHGVQSVFDHYFLLVDAKKAADELRRTVDELNSKLSQLQEVELENQRLRTALDFKQTHGGKLISAHVIAHDVSTDYVGVRIDRGAVDGVKRGMGVISPGGVVGRVHRVTDHYCDVLALNDPTSNVDIVVQRSRSRGILSGKANELIATLKYVDRLDDVQVDDSLVTTGHEGIFPPGLSVGTVTSVSPSPNGILQSVTVKTSINIYRLEEVFIVFPAAEPQKTAE